MHVRASERLTRTGPKRLHTLYMYVLSKCNAYNMNTHTHACMRERLTRTGPKRLHTLYMYVLSKCNAYNMNAHMHACTHKRTYAQLHIRAMGLKKRVLKRGFQGRLRRTDRGRMTDKNTCTAACQGNEIEENVFEKRKVFKEDLKELTDRNRELVPDNWSLVRQRALIAGLSLEGWYSVKTTLS